MTKPEKKTKYKKITFNLAEEIELRSNPVAKFNYEFEEIQNMEESVESEYQSAKCKLWETLQVKQSMFFNYMEDNKRGGREIHR